MCHLHPLILDAITHFQMNLQLKWVTYLNDYLLLLNSSHWFTKEGNVQEMCHLCLLDSSNGVRTKECTTDNSVLSVSILRLGPLKMVQNTARTSKY